LPERPRPAPVPCSFGKRNGRGPAKTTEGNLFPPASPQPENISISTSLQRAGHWLVDEQPGLVRFQHRLKTCSPMGPGPSTLFQQAPNGNHIPGKISNPIHKTSFTPYFLLQGSCLSLDPGRRSARKEYPDFPALVKPRENLATGLYDSWRPVIQAFRLKRVDMEKCRHPMIPHCAAQAQSGTKPSPIQSLNPRRQKCFSITEGFRDELLRASITDIAAEEPQLFPGSIILHHGINTGGRVQEIHETQSLF